MKKNIDKKKILLTIIGTVVVTLISILIRQYLFPSPSFDKALMQAASQINESCPIMVDQETRLDNTIALPDNVFQYNYTLVHLVKDSMDVKGFEEYMKPRILNHVKTDPGMKTVRKNKTTVAYSYKDKNGVFITTISVTPEMYSGE